MDTEGWFLPETEAEIHERYERLGEPARTVVHEIARAMSFDGDEYAERVTSDVVMTARDALFASLLVVNVGTADEFDDWVANEPAYESIVIGSDVADNVVWHAAPFAETVVAATYHHEREAAIGTLRRQAFGRLYREVIHG